MSKFHGNKEQKKNLFYMFCDIFALCIGLNFTPVVAEFIPMEFTSHFANTPVKLTHARYTKTVRFALIWFIKVRFQYKH